LIFAWCADRLSATSQLKTREGLLWTYGFSPWSLGPVVAQYVVTEAHGGEGCESWQPEGKERQEEANVPFQGRCPGT
jgi:hypothetical protein